ncbi:MAG: hypothetical protein JWL68_3013 [Actinomycetia bacterium]|nr:hypothetical protein [Actinomycetes bacterium]
MYASVVLTFIPVSIYFRWHAVTIDQLTCRHIEIKAHCVQPLTFLGKLKLKLKLKLKSWHVIAFIRCAAGIFSYGFHHTIYDDICKHEDQQYGYWPVHLFLEDVILPSENVEYVKQYCPDKDRENTHTKYAAKSLGCLQLAF